MGNRILIADDININRKLIKKVLQKKIQGLEIIEAKSGDEVLRLLFTMQIDLLILDLMMPVVNGYEVLKKMQESDKLKEIPSIVISAMDGIQYIKAALEAGAGDYFTKPFTMDQLEVLLPVKAQNALKINEQRKSILNINEKMKEQISLARVLQSTLIANSKEMQRVAMKGVYIPCREVGGDYFDCIQNGSSYYFIIADVSGNGVAAAMLSSMIKVMFSNSVAQNPSPDEVLTNMNKVFYNLTGGLYYFTAFVGMLKDTCLYYSNGGHPYPVLFSTKKDNCLVLGQNGMLLGAFENAEFKSENAEIDTGDLLILYTDGLFETVENKDNIDFISISEKIGSILQRMHAGKFNSIGDIRAEDILENILRLFSKSRMSSSLEDDVAVSVIRFK